MAIPSLSSLAAYAFGIEEHPEIPTSLMKIPSRSAELLDRLRKLNQIPSIYKTDYEFAEEFVIKDARLHYDAYGVQGSFISNGNMFSFFFVDTDLCHHLTVSSDEGLIAKEEIAATLCSLGVRFQVQLPEAKCSIQVLNNISPTESCIIEVNGNEETIMTKKKHMICRLSMGLLKMEEVNLIGNIEDIRFAYYDLVRDALEYPEE